MQKLINKAIKHYKYAETLDIDEANYFFLDEYNYFSRKGNLKKHINIVWLSLSGIPNCTHIRAKNLLFQGNKDCWKYFERTAVFWTYGHNKDKWIDHLKGV
ncbi:hypothetical protein, partial [Lacinutrix salivirga]